MVKRDNPLSPLTNFAAATASSTAAFPSDGRLGKHAEHGLIAGPAVDVDEETLVVDDRSALSPAQMVETKLSRKLQATSVPVSHLQMRVLLRTR